MCISWQNILNDVLRKVVDGMPKPQKTEEEKQILREVGRRIFEARKKKGIKSAEKLGEMMNPSLSSSQQSVSAWETGAREIGLLNLIKLAMALDISLDELAMGAVQEVKRKTKKKYTLRDACEFLFMTLPEATGAKFRLSNVENLHNSLHRFDCDKHPCIQLSIPLPVVILHDPETGYPTGEVRLNECARKMAIFADTVAKLNESVKARPARYYEGSLSEAPNTPLVAFRSENSDNGIPF